MAQTNVAVTPGSGKNIDGFATSGTGNVRQAVVIADPSTDANTASVDASGNLQTKISNGTNTADVAAGDSGNNSVVTSVARKEVTFTTTTAQALASTDVSNYASVSVHITSQGGSSTVTFQCSNDNSTWVSVSLNQSAAVTAQAATTTAGIWFGNLAGRYFRLNVTGIVSGTTAGTIEFYSASKQFPFVNAAQSGTFTVQPGNTANTTPWLMKPHDGTNAATIKAASTATGASDTSLVVALSPNSSALSDGTTSGNVVAGDSGNNAQVVTGSRKEVAFTTTTVQAVASTDVSNYKWVSVHVTSQGTSSVVNFQGSNDNSNWTAVSLQYAGAIGTTSLGISTNSSNVIYAGPLNFRYFRLNVTGIAAGTTAGTIEVFSLPAAVMSNQVAVTQSGTWTVQPGNTANTTPWLASINDGSTTGSNVAGDSGQNAQVVTGSRKEVSFTTVTAQAVASTDCSNYRWVSVHITSQGGSSLVTFQTSNDNSNWVGITLFSSSGSAAAGQTSTSGAATIFHGPITGRYFRLNVTGIVSGTTAGVCEFFSIPVTPQELGVTAAQSGTWTVGSNSATGSAVPANSFYEGGNAATALPTAATAGNLTGATYDKFGRQVVLPNTIRDLVGTQTTTISASTSETTIVTAAASIFNDLIALVVSNTSATAARLDFRDTTAGSILFSLYAPAGDTRGFTIGTPIPQTSVNTNWTAQSSASVTDLRVYAVFAKNK